MMSGRARDKLWNAMRRGVIALGVGCGILAGGGVPVAAAKDVPGLPEIRTSRSNPVPGCVTPERLMRFLKQRNDNLYPKFENIAVWYKEHGERWRVRWDYAFFQMAVETNFLTYRRGDGKWGDVRFEQNNFAGIGTTGGGVPGNGFPDVSTGVLAQIQHLVAYSGERLEDPVAPRTRLKQDDIIALSLQLGRPVRFSDLSRRWAVDRNYGKSIAWVAARYYAKFCNGREVATADLPSSSGEHVPWDALEPKTPSLAAASTTPRRVVPKPKAAAKIVVPKIPEKSSDKTPGETAAVVRPPVRPLPTKPEFACHVTMVSYGGKKTVLMRETRNDGERYTALTVLDGFETSMTKGYIKSHAPEATVIGEFTSVTAAVDKARHLCKN